MTLVGMEKERDKIKFRTNEIVADLGKNVTIEEAVGKAAYITEYAIEESKIYEKIMKNSSIAYEGMMKTL